MSAMELSTKWAQLEARERIFWCNWINRVVRGERERGHRTGNGQAWMLTSVATHANEYVCLIYSLMLVWMYHTIITVWTSLIVNNFKLCSISLLGIRIYVFCRKFEVSDTPKCSNGQSKMKKRELEDYGGLLFPCQHLFCFFTSSHFHLYFW